MKVNPTYFKSSENINQDKIENTNYIFTNSLDLLLICIALGEQNKYREAIELFERFKTKIQKNNNIIFGLITIIAICKENSDFILADIYFKELEIIEN